MALSHSPAIATSGLIFHYDVNNIRSYKGPVVTNLATSISIFGTGTGTGYASTATIQDEHVPGIGATRVYTNNIQNNYTSYTPNSTNCCPSLHGWGGFSVSPSTLYTYGIVYRCDSGYTNSNYMYRYEYTANGGAYVTEGGVYNDSNRVSLGNGWYYAWGTFTTQATTNWLGHCGSFYYRYSSYTDRLSIAKVMIVAGNYAGMHPMYWPQNTYSMSATQSHKDLSINNNTINAISLAYSANGYPSFNGSSNYLSATGPGFTSAMPSYTIAFWARRDTENRMPVASYVGTTFYWYGDNSWRYTHGGVGGEYYYAKPTSIPLGTWGHYCVTYDGANVNIYRQGTLQGQQATTGTADWSSGMTIGNWQGAGGYQWQGALDSVSMYNRALSAAEVAQNFNAFRGRYGV